MSQEAEAPWGIVKVDHMVHWEVPWLCSDVYKTLSPGSDSSGCFFPLPECHSLFYIMRQDKGQGVNPGIALAPSFGVVCRIHD